MQIEPVRKIGKRRRRRRSGRIVFIFSIILGLLAAGAAQAKSGLPLPRFATLRADKVNVRTGPGVRYPVEWVFVYRNMPVEIISEFDTWRKVRDWQGTVGWVHQSMLSGRRMIIVTKGVQALHREADADAPVIARLQKKVLGRLLECRKLWCRIEVSGHRGWMRRAQFWGAYSDERID